MGLFGGDNDMVYLFSHNEWLFGKIEESRNIFGNKIIACNTNDGKYIIFINRLSMHFSWFYTFIQCTKVQ